MYVFTCPWMASLDVPQTPENQGVRTWTRYCPPPAPSLCCFPSVTGTQSLKPDSSPHIFLNLLPTASWSLLLEQAPLPFSVPFLRPLHWPPYWSLFCSSPSSLTLLWISAWKQIKGGPRACRLALVPRGLPGKARALPLSHKGRLGLPW